MEFQQVYGLDVVQIPTNLALIRDDDMDLVFATEHGKFSHVVDEIVRFARTWAGPYWVGTVSIEKSELVASLLSERGVEDYQVLNAKYHEREASIVANAGKRAAITIATNMAGRGTDIKLWRGVRELGGLGIIGTERHESRRSDNQLRGRCGRQGDPGTTRFYVSLEDEVARLFGGDKVKKMLDWFGGNEMDEEPLQPEDGYQNHRARPAPGRGIQLRDAQGTSSNTTTSWTSSARSSYKIRRDVLEDRDVTEQLLDMFERIIGKIALAEYTPKMSIQMNGISKA